MHPPLIYFPDDRLSLPELCAARIDGHLVEIDDAYMPADTVESAIARALAVAPFVPEGACAMGPTAAWVHGAGDAAPHMHHIQRAGAGRLRVDTMRRRHFHDIGLLAGDGERVGPLLVTTPLRTLIDLARLSPGHPTFERWARALAEVSPVLVPAALSRIEAMGRMPGKKHAQALLGALEAPLRTS